MATKGTTHRQASNDRDLIERMVSALETRAAAATSNNEGTAETQSPRQPLSAQATAAIASFVKTANELAVLSPE